MAMTLSGLTNTCSRCGGLMVAEFSPEFSNDPVKHAFTSRRCVQCGEIIDSVILQNRRLRHESMRLQSRTESDQARKLGAPL
ncbi:MAG: hypothetical protein A4E19_10595 [Nitrospira sp. SG-bin1]|nr:MAG: hypothetical protein A4E19_10595 [Nitrospira sp. SG-bin1]